VAVNWTAERMWLPMEHELNFVTNQRAADGKDLVLCVEKRDRNNVFNKRERERERERETMMVLED